MLLPFTKQNVDIAPDAAGVYVLLDRKETIYIGRAVGFFTTIRSRLQSHQRGDEGVCTQRATHFAYEVTAKAAERERELLNGYVRRFGRLPRCNSRRA